MPRTRRYRKHNKNKKHSKHSKHNKTSKNKRSKMNKRQYRRRNTRKNKKLHRSRKQRKHMRRSNKRRYQRGGNNCGAQSTALVGKPWKGGDVSTWGKSNHYPLHNGQYPQAGMHSSDNGVPLEQRGGSFLPRDLVNLGRSVTGGVQNLYNGYRGVPPVNSALPNEDHPIDQRTKYIGGLPIDMTHRLREADDVVSKI